MRVPAGGSGEQVQQTRFPTGAETGGKPGVRGRPKDRPACLRPARVKKRMRAPAGGSGEQVQQTRLLTGAETGETRSPGTPERPACLPETSRGCGAERCRKRHCLLLTGKRGDQPGDWYTRESGRRMLAADRELETERSQTPVAVTWTHPSPLCSMTLCPCSCRYRLCSLMPGGTCHRWCPSASGQRGTYR